MSAWDALDDTREALLSGPKSVINTARSVWTGFQDFALRDNVLEVAVGLMIAAAFTAVVNSLVSDILLPPISLLPFLGHNLEEKFAVLKKGHTNSWRYNTVQQATDDGAVIMPYGLFLTNVFRFFCIGFAMYGLARLYAAVSHDTIIKQTVKCAYCRKYVSPKAKRCYLCTSWLDGREDNH